MKVFSRMAGVGLLIGVGAVAIGAVVIAPRALRAARPQLRAGLRMGLSGYDRLRSAAAEFAEDMEDLYAEVRAEMQTHDDPAPPQDDGKADVAEPDAKTNPAENSVG